MRLQPEHPTIHPTAAEPSRYCRRCGYELRGLTAPRCPECGRVFDPANPRTYRRRPIRRWLQRLIRTAVLILAFFLMLAVIWAWLYWGWYTEQQTIAELKPNGSVYCTPIISPLLRQYLGPTGFVFDRVRTVDLINRTDITDIKKLAGFTNLDHLGLDGTPVADLSPLAKLTNLDVIDLDRTRVTDLSILARLTKLRHLFLSGTKITDLSPLAGLTRLEYLDLCDMPVRDISPLARLANIEFIDLRGTPITDLSPLIGLTKVRQISLDRNPATDLSPLSGLPKLEILYLTDLTDKDLSPLSRLRNLRELGFSRMNNKVVDLAPLASLTKLERLYLNNAPVSDLTPLERLKSLYRLSLPHNITDTQIEALRRALPRCGIDRMPDLEHLWR